MFVDARGKRGRIPVRAAEYGTRDAPSKRKTRMRRNPQNHSGQKRAAAFHTIVRQTSLAMKSESAPRARHHAQELVCIARYSTAIPARKEKCRGDIFFGIFDSLRVTDVVVPQ